MGELAFLRLIGTDPALIEYVMDKIVENAYFIINNHDRLQKQSIGVKVAAGLGTRQFPLLVDDAQRRYNDYALVHIHCHRPNQIPQEGDEASVVFQGSVQETAIFTQNKYLVRRWGHNFHVVPNCDLHNLRLAAASVPSAASTASPG